MKKIIGIAILISALCISLAAEVFAGSVSVNYTYTGTEGDYLLNFTITNNIPAQYEQKIYMWGVSISETDTERGFPEGWGLSQAYAPESVLVYGNGWATDSFSDWRVLPGASLSGFTLNTATIPDEISFIAWASPFPSSTEWSELYYYSDDVWGGQASLNPCITGLVGPGQYMGGTESVPESATMLLLAFGLFGIARFRKIVK